MVKGVNGTMGLLLSIGTYTNPKGENQLKKRGNDLNHCSYSEDILMQQSNSRGGPKFGGLTLSYNIKRKYKTEYFFR